MWKGTFVVLVTALMLAPGALAASPDEIYADLADNGRLDGTYTQAELQAYLQSAQVQGYGNPIVVVTPPVVTPPVVAPPQAPAPTQAPPTSGVAGEQKTITPKPAAKPAAQPTAQVAGAQSPPIAQTASAGTLPFTGAELGIFALVGGALLLGGLLLRASARQR
jgi:hypothetical protein